MTVIPNNNRHSGQRPSDLGVARGGDEAVQLASASAEGAFVAAVAVVGGEVGAGEDAAHREAAAFPDGGENGPDARQIAAVVADALHGPGQASAGGYGGEEQQDVLPRHIGLHVAGEGQLVVGVHLGRHHVDIRAAVDVAAGRGQILRHERADDLGVFKADDGVHRGIAEVGSQHIGRLRRHAAVRPHLGHAEIVVHVGVAGGVVAGIDIEADLPVSLGRNRYAVHQHDAVLPER